MVTTDGGRDGGDGGAAPLNTHIPGGWGPATPIKEGGSCNWDQRRTLEGEMKGGGAEGDDDSARGGTAGSGGSWLHGGQNRHGGAENGWWVARRAETGGNTAKEADLAPRRRGSWNVRRRPLGPQGRGERGEEERLDFTYRKPGGRRTRSVEEDRSEQGSQRKPVAVRGGELRRRLSRSP